MNSFSSPAKMVVNLLRPEVVNFIGAYNKYGSQPVPRLYLIDKTGKVIYDSAGVENNDYQLIGLRKTLEGLKIH